MVVRRILAGALLAPLLLLSACGGDDTSVADPPVAPTSPSTSAAHPPHRESAKAFIRRWAKAEQDMENTGETTRYLALSSGCRACRDLAHQISAYYAAGGYVRWGGWTLLSIRRATSSGDFMVSGLNFSGAPVSSALRRSEEARNVRTREAASP